MCMRYHTTSSNISIKGWLNAGWVSSLSYVDDTNFFFLLPNFKFPSSQVGPFKSWLKCQTAPMWCRNKFRIGIVEQNLFLRTKFMWRPFLLFIFYLQNQVKQLHEVLIFLCEKYHNGNLKMLILKHYFVLFVRRYHYSTVSHNWRLLIYNFILFSNRRQ